MANSNRAAPEQPPDIYRRQQGVVNTAVATLEKAGLSVKSLDEHFSLVAGRFEWHRTTNRWTERGTNRVGYGLGKLIEAAKSPHPPSSNPPPDR